jgi:hypothetical protein
LLYRRKRYRGKNLLGEGPFYLCLQHAHLYILPGKAVRDISEWLMLLPDNEILHDGMINVNGKSGNYEIGEKTGKIRGQARELRGQN